VPIALLTDHLRRASLLPLLVLGLAACGAAGKAPNATGAAGTTGAGGDGGTSGPDTRMLTVQGNRLVDGTGKTVRLLGVNRAGTEYMCATATVKSVFDGPTGDETIAAMLSWHINTVRLPLNESCWLGLAGATEAGGDFYRTLIQEYVDRLHAHGIYVVLDLHWTASGNALATDQKAMADADHAIDLWKSVAGFFKSDPMILFDLFNEPFLDRAGAADPWGCWLSGCAVQGWQSAGMQAMVDAVRGTGAKQVIIANGLDYSNKLDGWLAHKPQDPTGNLMAGFHLYSDGACASAGCWNGTVGAVAQQVPLVTGELGQRDCSHGFIDGYMSWADGHGIGYLGWAWNPVNCSTFPALITDWDGAATTFGLGLQTHLAQVNP
jgi:endoglucanase